MREAFALSKFQKARRSSLWTGSGALGLEPENLVLFPLCPLPAVLPVANRLLFQHLGPAEGSYAGTDWDLGLQHLQLVAASAGAPSKCEGNS